jgi:hypothetical protein
MLEGTRHSAGNIGGAIIDERQQEQHQDDYQAS